MNFSLSEDHVLLRDSTHDFLRRNADLAPLLVPGADAASAPYEKLWPQLCELGWPAMMVPEEHGGLGLSMVDLAMVLRESGRFLAASPLFGTLAGTWALLAAADPAQQARVLPEVAAGRLRLALAFADANGAAEGGGCAVQARAGGSEALVQPAGESGAQGYLLAGDSHYVVDAPDADAFIVCATLAGVRRLFLVDRRQAGVQPRRLEWRDITRRVAHVHWDDAVAELLPVGWAEAWPGLRSRLWFTLAAESAGGLQAVLDDTAAYARERVAFGRPIGAYQAIKHSLADMLAQTECANTALLYAAWALSQPDGEAATLATAMAQSHASDAYREATHRSIQVFGAIGFTWEMKNHLYYKRARANAVLLGEPARQREVIATILEQRKETLE